MLNISGGDGDNLESLIQESMDSLDTPTTQKKRKSSLSGHGHIGRNLLYVVFLVVIVFSFNRAIESLTPGVSLADEAIQSDMVSILHQANNALEINITATGTPPPILPNASLARIVHYHVRGNYYELAIFLNGNTATLDSTGVLTINGEIRDD